MTGSSTDLRPRVLHLAFEDPRAPGSGGGSVRTREMNSRLADRFRITTVTAGYPGARDRFEDGVRWVQAGVPGPRAVRLLSYFAAIPAVLARYDADLVVEDFAAPFGSVGVPRLTRRPVLGVVQWLFAAEKAEQYRLPFDRVEAAGLATHTDLVAVSEGLAEQLRARNPRARVTAVPNGLEPAAFAPRERERSGLLFLGRLDVAQKGLDLLLEAYARVADRVAQDLTLVGDGPDEARVRLLADRLGVGHRVHLPGRTEGDARFDVLAGADAVLMPSRYETFGMVAAEALAVGTPVLAFDIPCLRDLLQPADLVPSFDVDAYAAALLTLAADPALRRRRAAAAVGSVQELHWDSLADRQAAVYDDVLARHRR